MTNYEKTDYIDYLSKAKNKESLFYGNGTEDVKEKNIFELPEYNKMNWRTHLNRFWFYMINEEYDFPDQGWKIHITSNINDSDRILYDVSKYLIQNKISFKFVPNKNELLKKNQKYSDRAAAGKFITIYPQSEEHFLNLLDELKTITDIYDLGPYILNDKQWKNSNVFFRYGGLKSIEKKINGLKALMIKDANGNLVPDKRVPYYYLPDFVHEPKELMKNTDNSSSIDNSALSKFNIISSLHFSNSGGVYLAEKNGKKCVIKEGRRGAGIDSKNEDAFTRNRNEYWALKNLEGIDGVIDVNEYFTVWENNYFTEPYIESGNLFEYVAKEFPFSNGIGKDKIDNYVENCIKIIDGLEKTIINIHKKGIAIGDMSLNNVIVLKNNTPLIIDLETATFKNNQFNSNIATPGFHSEEAQSNEQQDWFALFRIARNLFLPINNIIDLAPKIIYKHNLSIKKKFGNKVLNYLNGLELKASRFCNVTPVSPYISQLIDVPKETISIENINQTKVKIEKGIISNFDRETDRLIRGDISQYHSEIDKYNIAFGCSGAILSLIRSDEQLIENLNDLLLKKSNSLNLKLNEFIDDDDTDIGLYTGITGIITTIYEMGYKATAVKFLKRIKIEKLLKSDDISLFSGLSGVGLMYLSFYSITKDEYFLKNCELIYQKLIDKYNQITQEDDYGLLTGWSGVALYFLKYGLYFKNERSLSYIINILEMATKLFSKPNDKHENVDLINTDKGFERLVPYLKNGSAGIALLLIELKKDFPGLMTEKLEKLLLNILESDDLFCTYNVGLLDGISGIIPLYEAARGVLKNNDLKKIVQGLDLFLATDQDDNILVPGNYGMKFSMDFATGASGVLSVVNDMDNSKKWSTWMPIVESDLHLFVNE